MLKITKTESWFYVKFNEMDKPPARLRKETEDINIKIEIGAITTEFMYIENVIKEYF
jgi:hypothetical protein